MMIMLTVYYNLSYSRINKKIKTVYITNYSLFHKFFKRFRNNRDATDCFTVFVIWRNFLLKNWMISASFKLSEKLLLVKHSLKKFVKVSKEVLQVNFNLSGGIVFLFTAILVTFSF